MSEKQPEATPGRPKLTDEEREAGKKATAAKKLAKQEARYLAGYCFFCASTKKNTTGTKRCAECRAKLHARQNQRNAELQEEHRCLRCKKKLPKSRTGVRCVECAAAHAEAKARYKARSKAATKG